MNLKSIIKIIITILIFSLAGCVSQSANNSTVQDYPDPPEDQRYEVLPIYIAWNGFDESWTYKFDKDGIIEECGPPPEPEYDEDDLFIDDFMPGGRTIWFRGLSADDVVITFVTENDSGKVVDIQKYTIRSYDDDMMLAILNTEHNSFRE